MKNNAFLYYPKLNLDNKNNRIKINKIKFSYNSYYLISLLFLIIIPRKKSLEGFIIYYKITLLIDKSLVNYKDITLNIARIF